MSVAVAPGTVKNFRLSQVDFIDFATYVLRSRLSDGSYPVTGASELILFCHVARDAPQFVSVAVTKQRLWGVAQWCMQQGSTDPRIDKSGKTWIGLELVLSEGRVTDTLYGRTH